MNQQWFHKPENALRRANELDAVGNKLGALKLLHDLISQRKNRQWQKSFEDIMCRYMDLAVEQQNFRAAKDGLHQYRNMSQQQAPGSLEVVIVYLLDLGEKKAAEAQASVSETVRAKAAKITDLDEETSPEMIMLSTMTDEGDRERADRALLVPWLRFLWETYRAVLDILRTNSKLEHVYVEGALLLRLVLARVVLLRRTATATAPLHLYCYYQPTHPPLSQVPRHVRQGLCVLQQVHPQDRVPPPVRHAAPAPVGPPEGGHHQARPERAVQPPARLGGVDPGQHRVAPHHALRAA